MATVAKPKTYTVHAIDTNASSSLPLVAGDVNKEAGNLAAKQAIFVGCALAEFPSGLCGARRGSPHPQPAAIVRVENDRISLNRTSRTVERSSIVVRS
jgi:hypothetical protein